MMQLQLSSLSLLRSLCGVILCTIYWFIGTQLVVSQTQTRYPKSLIEEKGTLLSDEYQSLCGSWCSHHNRKTNTLMERPSLIQRRPYDVIAYNLYMDWTRPLSDTGSTARRYTGRNEIIMRIDSNAVNTIRLDARNLRIDTCTLVVDKLASVSIPLSSITQRGDTLSVRLPSALNQGSLCTLRLSYTQTSTTNPGDYGGFNNYKRGRFQNDTIYENICYTMSQPNNARRWMPCNDAPYDKAISSISVRVPLGYTACSNGLLVSTINDTPTSTVFNWSDSTPIPTYLMVAAASKFVIHNVTYNRVSDGKPIQVPLYLWAQDSAEFTANLVKAHDVVPEMMTAFSREYGEYPFVKYGTVLLHPYFNGGMEHQNMTTNHRRTVTQIWDEVIAHELMHMWTGDKVTCATWGDIWLNEGGATYGEYLWKEFSEGKQVAREYQADKRDRAYFRGDSARIQPTVFASDISSMFNGGTTYIKGGWIYHMIRSMLGDSAYFSFMRQYMNRYAYSSVETEQMITMLEELFPNPPVSFRTFFEQWIYRKGHPIYRASLDYARVFTPIDIEANVVVSQLQSELGFSEYPEVFEMPITLRFTSPNGDTYDTVVVNNQRNQRFNIKLKFIPTSMKFDPDENILCQKENSEIVITGVNDEASNYSSNSLTVYPAPVQKGRSFTISYPVTETTNRVSIDVFSLAGERVLNVMDSEINYSQHGGINRVMCSTHGLPVGAYILRMKTQGMELRDNAGQYKAGQSGAGDNFIFTTLLVTE
jgi:aminopeptidase N